MRFDELYRFMMSLLHEDFERLGELAALLGQSRAALMRDLIESARPVWSVLLDAARTTAAVSSAQRAAMASLAEQMGVQLDEAQGVFDLLTARLGEPDGPPASNTGVTTP